ncbi:hypothetical protein DTL42_20800 [Bremerella cremea]|uniref:Uncharacterized protein n=1 Tax=Bremerella cremea TaxID=1031537 RepID=A0A368KMI0_9BACT|nr:hypothetical protein [Bremerella cremea]RCS41032.1 hypothetical protein DTL42_20800 [Bremerella cremea]
MGTILQRGITGFRDRRDQPLPMCDLNAFRSACHTVSQVTKCSLSAPIQQPNNQRNFITAQFATPYGEIAAMLNQHFPLLGFAVASLPGKQLRFVDAPEQATAFTQLGMYRVLSLSDLQQPITDDDLASLSPTEIEQVNYWKPTSLGQIIFNAWD